MTGVRNKEIVVSYDAAASLVPDGLYASLTILLACSWVYPSTEQSFGILIGKVLEKKSRLTSWVGPAYY